MEVILKYETDFTILHLSAIQVKSYIWDLFGVVFCHIGQVVFSWQVELLANIIARFTLVVFVVVQCTLIKHIYYLSKHKIEDGLNKISSEVWNK